MTIKQTPEGVEIDFEDAVILSKTHSAFTFEGFLGEDIPRTSLTFLRANIYGNYNMSFWKKIRRCWFLIKYTFRK